MTSDTIRVAGRLSKEEVVGLIRANNKSTFSTELLLCLIWKESSFDPAAKNPTTSATGLMMMTRGAVDTVNNTTPTGVHFEHSEMTDKVKNIQAGTYYLKYLLREWGNAFEALRHFGTLSPTYPQVLQTCEACVQAHPNNSDPCLHDIHSLLANGDKINPVSGSMREILLDQYATNLRSINLIPISSKYAIEKSDLPTLPFSLEPLFAYVENYCHGGNDCPDGQFDSDCTHFLCHALATGGLQISNTSASCRSGLCIRVNDFAAAFDNATRTYTNVHKLAGYEVARRGDFCFIPSWFPLRKDHAMFLAAPPQQDANPQATGAAVYAHTNSHCGEFNVFDVTACVYYRIDPSP
jgi:hypothetical protein